MSSPYLFKLVDTPENGGYARGKVALDTLNQANAAPDLVPYTSNAPENTQVIDVINNFPWTQTPATGRHEVPFIRLSEYRIKFNSLVQNIKYQLAVGKEVGTEITNKLGIKVPNFGTEDLSDNSSARKAHNQALRAAGDDKDKQRELTDKWNERVKANTEKGGLIRRAGLAVKGAVDLNTPRGMPPYLSPYWGLYGAVPTGFEYYMPYFHNEWKQTTSSWGDIEGGGIFSIVTDLFSKEGIGSTFTNSIMIDQDVLGAYIERPKMYSYQTEGPEKSFSITLLNTENEEDIVRNWHLAFMLAYQQLPNRTSKVLLEPPVIYEIEIPGIFYSPFAFISSLRITNRGATRVLKIPYHNIASSTNTVGVETTGTVSRNQSRWDKFSTDLAAKKTMGEGLWKKIVNVENINKSKDSKPRLVETIIPDAYQIDITIKSLIPESKNLFYHSALGAGTLGAGLYSAYVANPLSNSKQKSNRAISNQGFIEGLRDGSIRDPFRQSPSPKPASPKPSASDITHTRTLLK